MVTLAQAIEIPELLTDRQEAAAMAPYWAKRMPTEMRRGRSDGEIEFDCLGGIVCERDLVREVQLRFLGSGALMSCLTQQHSGRPYAGPDFLFVKGTLLDEHSINLAEAFARDYRLRVYYGPKGLHNDTRVYALVFRSKNRAWLVGAATKEQVLASKDHVDSSLVIPLSKLTISPAMFFDMFK